MRRQLSCFIMFGLLLGTCVDVLGIATSNDVISAQSPVNQGYTFNWDYIYKYKNASSVAVDHYWILTALHVADDAPSGDLLIDGETYTQQEIVFHPTADLALVRYDKPFPGYYGLHSGEISQRDRGQTTYDPLIMSGYGYPGTVTATTFSQSGSAGIKRWGTNRGVSEAMVDADIGGGVIKSTQCFRTTFVLGDTTFEAGANTYDSGGPVFIDRDGSWSLTGILLYRPTTSENRAAMIHDYIDWVTNSIPDYDTDMDGLPDWWETLYGGNATSMDATADLDATSTSPFVIGEPAAVSHTCLPHSCKK